MLAFPLSQTVFSVIGFLLAVGLMVVVHEFGHFFAARKLGIHVLRFSVGFGPVLWRWKDKRGTEYALSALPLGGYVKMLGESSQEPIEESDRSRSFEAQSVWRRMLVLFAGPFANLVFACLSLWLVFVTGFPAKAPVLVSSAPIEQVRANSPAEKSGLKKGDLILAVDQKPVGQLEDFIHYVQSKPQQVIRLTIARKDHTLQVQVNPETVIAPSGEKIGVIGIQFAPFPIHFTRLPPGIALQRAVSSTAEYVLLTMQMIKKMLCGETTTRHLGGPLAIAEQAGQSLKMGVWGFAGFLAMTSTGLAVFNLLPIPVLDGGQMVYCVIEAIRRRPPSLRARLIGLWVGGFLLLLLSGLAFYNDFERFGLL